MIGKINFLNNLVHYLRNMISRMLGNDNYTSQIVYSTHKSSSKPRNTSSIKPQKTKKILVDWIKSFNHTHFLTLQLPENIKTSNFETSKSHLRKIMAKFESYLLGRHWNKKHLPFMCFAEKGRGNNWHYHILFSADNLTTQQLELALDKTASFLKLPLYSLKLIPIDSENNYTNFYCIKEIRINKYETFDSDRIIISDCLFNISKK